MSRYVLSGAADQDVQSIAIHSVRNWGRVRAARYVAELHEAFENLAAFPNIGRDAGHLRNGYFLFPHNSHAIYYQKTEDGIFIVRVLHQRQPPETYL